MKLKILAKAMAKSNNRRAGVYFGTSEKGEYNFIVTTKRLVANREIHETEQLYTPETAILVKECIDSLLELDRIADRLIETQGVLGGSIEITKTKGL